MQGLNRLTLAIVGVIVVSAACGMPTRREYVAFRQATSTSTSVATAVATTVAPTTTTAVALPEPEHITLASVVGSIPYQTATLLPEWVIVAVPPKKGLEGLTIVAQRRIEIGIRDSWSLDHFRHVVAHEIGHAVDVTLLDDGARRDWAESRRSPGLEWWPGSDGVTDFDSGAGDFAESFAWTMLGGGEWFSVVAPPPDAEQQDLLRRLIGRTGR